MNEPRELVRGLIVDQIASRCGQLPDLHPRLVEGVEAAADALVSVIRNARVAELRATANDFAGHSSAGHHAAHNKLAAAQLRYRADRIERAT